MIFRKKVEKEFEVPKNMVLIPRHILQGYLAECESPVPNLGLKLHYLEELEELLKEEFRTFVKATVKNIRENGKLK